MSGERYGYGGLVRYRLEAFMGAFTTNEMFVSVQLATYI